MKYKTPSFVHKRGVVLSPEQVPYPCALSFNAGVTRYGDGYAMLFRNDYGFCEQDFIDYYAGTAETDHTVPKTNIGLAFSKDGSHWNVESEPVFSLDDGDIWRVYDPRITVLENGEYCVTFAVDSKHGVRGAIATTSDFRSFDIKSISVPENRNMVLFPERINGKYYRLERPFVSSGLDSYAVWLSASEDLVHWGESKLVFDSTSLKFINSKIGPAAPPLKTKEGWLTLFHGVEETDYPIKAWEKNWKRRYFAGVMLLDLEDPSKIISIAERPLLVPEEEYEMSGFRGEVIFPGGMIAEDDGTVKVYYGAADTVECLAEMKMSDLMSFVYNK